MSKNKIIISLDENGITGLKCECGNFESITDDNPDYKRFSYWMNHPKKTSEGCCRVCNSETHTIEVSREVQEKTKTWLAEKQLAEKK